MLFLRIGRAVMLFGLLFGSGTAVQAAVLTFEQTFFNPTPADGDAFGSSISLHGGRALVGAQLDDAGAISAGAAYLFDLTTGALLHTLANPTPTIVDRYGLSVSLGDNYALVGSPNDDANVTNAGSAYLFDAATGAVVRTFSQPNPQSSDSFGTSVALDAGIALIGAPNRDDGARNAGAAYLFDTDGNLLQTFLNPDPQRRDQFGSQVALFGNHALVGAENDDSGASGAGAAYLFDTATGGLVHTFLNPTPGRFDLFGASLALSDDKALIGAAFDDDANGTNEGAAYLFDLGTGDLEHTLTGPDPLLSQFFGDAVSLAGSRALVGSPFGSAGGPNTGVAYLFDTTTGALLETVADSTPQVLSVFGGAVALTDDGALIAAERGRVGGAATGLVSHYVLTPPPPPPPLESFAYEFVASGFRGLDGETGPIDFLQGRFGFTLDPTQDAPSIVPDFVSLSGPIGSTTFDPNNTLVNFDRGTSGAQIFLGGLASGARTSTNTTDDFVLNFIIDDLEANVPRSAQVIYSLEGVNATFFSGATVSVLASTEVPAPATLSLFLVGLGAIARVRLGRLPGMIRAHRIPMPRAFRR